MQNIQLDRIDINHLLRVVQDRIVVCKVAVKDSRSLLHDALRDNPADCSAGFLGTQLDILTGRSYELARLERIHGQLTQLWEQEDELH